MSHYYDLHVSGSAPALWPAEIHFALLWIDDTVALEVPKRFPLQGRWGEILSTQQLETDGLPMPRKLDMVWLSIVEQTFYSLEADLPTERMEELWQQTDNDGEPLYTHIVVGMAPYGRVAMWLRGRKKGVLLEWLQGRRINLSPSASMPSNPYEKIDAHCRQYIKGAVLANLQKKGLPPHELFDRIMAQYCYRLVPLFEQWRPDAEVKWQRHASDDEQIPCLEHMDVSCVDGTLHKLHDDFLSGQHRAGRPERIAMTWRTGRSQWSAYFWIDENQTATIFERFYGAHRDTLADLLVHCDPQAKHYELALYRYGLPAPRVLPPESYQLIVFKNKYEHYRSDNYRKSPEAWIW